MNYSFHRIAELYPMCTDAEMQEMEESIRKNGLREPISRYQGKILDGRNRYLACMTVGVKPEFVDWCGEDPIDFVEIKNSHRRHLTATQRAMVAARTLAMRREQEPELNNNIQKGQYCPSGNSFKVLPLLPSPLSVEAAKQKVSERTVKKANTVLKEGLLPLQHCVDAEKVSLSLAAKVAKEPKKIQEEFIERVERNERPTEAFDGVMHREYEEEKKKPEGRAVFCPHCSKMFMLED